MQFVIVLFVLATLTLAMVAWNRDIPPLPAHESNDPGDQQPPPPSS